MTQSNIVQKKTLESRDGLRDGEYPATSELSAELVLLLLFLKMEPGERGAVPDGAWCAAAAVAARSGKTQLASPCWYQPWNQVLLDLSKRFPTRLLSAILYRCTDPPAGTPIWSS